MFGLAAAHGSKGSSSAPFAASIIASGILGVDRPGITARTEERRAGPIYRPSGTPWGKKIGA